jgi:hypothetical protein
MPVCQATTTACYFRVDNLVIWVSHIDSVKSECN